MNQSQAETIATIYGGHTWCPHPGANEWLVIVPRVNGSAIVFSSDGVYDYPNIAMFEDGEPTSMIEWS